MLGRWKRSGESDPEKASILFPDNALPLYGSTISSEKALDKSSAHPTSSSKWQQEHNMALRSGMRLISATEVVLPPVKWYQKLYIPGLVRARPSPHSNTIVTSKYTVLNFIFKNMWEQFHRLANVYFLFIALLNFVPAVEAVGREVAFIPLFFVLSVTAARDIFEDYRRHKSDKEVNRKQCRVYSR